ncbi:MAG: hypothetical protein E5V25_31260, partial [Mesorhizobium sp.]
MANRRNGSAASVKSPLVNSVSLIVFPNSIAGRGDCRLSRIAQPFDSRQWSLIASASAQAAVKVA